MKTNEYLRLKEIIAETFKMEFQSDEQRKAVFASIAGNYPKGFDENERAQIDYMINRIKNGKESKESLERGLKLTENALEREHGAQSVLGVDKKRISDIKKGIAAYKFVLSKYDELAPKLSKRKSNGGTASI